MDNYNFTSQEQCVDLDEAAEKWGRGFKVSTLRNWCTAGTPTGIILPVIRAGHRVLTSQGAMEWLFKHYEPTKRSREEIAAEARKLAAAFDTAERRQNPLLPTESKAEPAAPLVSITKLVMDEQAIEHLAGIRHSLSQIAAACELLVEINKPFALSKEAPSNE